MSCRLLAESNTASSLAAAIDIEVQDQLQQADHFSIAALQLTASSLSGSQASYTRTALLTALLQAAIACSANTQLSEQFMAAGLMGTITALLDEGNVHNPQTALAVELLWNLLDSCPVTEPKAVSSSVSANSGPRLQIAKESQLSAEADPESGEADLDASVAEASDAEQATNVNLTAGLEAESSAVLNQQGSSKWDFAQGSQELAAESDTASTPSIVDDLTATGRSRAHSLATTGRSMPRSLVATMATTGRSTMQSRHGASVKFSDIGDDGEATAGDEDVRTASPDAAGVPSDNPPASHDTQALLEEDSTAESAAISPLPEIEIDQQSQQLASSLSRLFENCLERGHSQADKELRNTVLLVAGLLAESCMYRAALCQAGLLQTLLAVSTEPELQELTPTYFQVGRSDHSVLRKFAE